MEAICSGDRSFYEDGRHHELADLLPIIYQALEIKPWTTATPFFGRRSALWTETLEQARELWAA
jgi:hypothetical protein